MGMDLIIADASASWWSPLLPSFIGGLTGGFCAVVAQVVANLLQRDAARRAEERSVDGTLKALMMELAAIKHDFLQPLQDTLRKQEDDRVTLRELQRNVSPMQLTPTEQNYFTVFDSNSSVLGRINDEQLLQDIVRVYGNAKGLFDYLNANPRLHEKWSNFPQGSEEKRRAARDLDDLEEHIRRNAAELETLVTKVADDIKRSLEN
jgi:hypothetical protein